MDPRLADEVIKVVDARHDQLQRSLPRTAYGVVTAIDGANRKATVAVSGEAVASGGFRFSPNYVTLRVNDLVRVVIDPRGDRYVDGVYGDWEAGTVFPASPTAGQRVFRTDRGLEYYWDGSRWLCTCLHTVTVEHPGGSTAFVLGRIPHPGRRRGWSIWIEGFAWTGFLLGGSGVNDGTNYWQGLAHTVDAGTLSLIAFANTSGLGINQQVYVSADHGVAYATTFEAIELRWHEINSSQDMADAGGIMEYRFIG